MKKLLLAFTMLIGFSFIQADGLGASATKEMTKEERIVTLYVAIFGRAPDSGGLEYWVETDISIEEIAMNFFTQIETQLKYPPEYTVHNFILQVYRNVFNRYPDKGGQEYWIEAIESGKVHRSVFILAVINGAQGDDITILRNKMMVGLAFVRAGLDDLESAYCIISGITKDPASVKLALEAIKRMENGGNCKLDPQPVPPAPVPPKPRDKAPIAVNDFAETAYNTPVLVDVLANDFDVD